DPQRARGARAWHAGLLYRARTTVRPRREVPDGRGSGRQRSAAAPSGPSTPLPPEHDLPQPRRREGNDIRRARGEYGPHPVPDRSRPRSRRLRREDARAGVRRARRVDRARRATGRRGRARARSVTHRAQVDAHSVPRRSALCEEDTMTTELVIDCDGHILEPPDLWETYLEPAYRDRALR